MGLKIHYVLSNGMAKCLKTVLEKDEGVNNRAKSTLFVLHLKVDRQVSRVEFVVEIPSSKRLGITNGSTENSCPKINKILLLKCALSSVIPSFHFIN